MLLRGPFPGIVKARYGDFPPDPASPLEDMCFSHTTARPPIQLLSCMLNRERGATHCGAERARGIPGQWRAFGRRNRVKNTSFTPPPTIFTIGNSISAREARRNIPGDGESDADGLSFGREQKSRAGGTGPARESVPEASR